MANDNEQEAFWRGEFGDAYAERNRGGEWVAASAALFARILRSGPPPCSVLELGANIGLNLQALRTLLPSAELAAVEINARAAAELRAAQPSVEVFETALADFKPQRRWELVFTKGVLIHIAPEQLPAVYDLLHAASARDILVAEYYAPEPTDVLYRGERGKLFKRDFAGELLERFSDLRLVDYGFVYRRDPVFPQDDLTWFLLRKRG